MFPELYHLFLENQYYHHKVYPSNRTSGGSLGKNSFAKQETRVRSLGQDDPLEKEVATHSSILAWEIPWTEEPGGLRSMGSQRVAHDLATTPSINQLTSFHLSILLSIISSFFCVHSSYLFWLVYSWKMSWWPDWSFNSLTCSLRSPKMEIVTLLFPYVHK